LWGVTTVEQVILPSEFSKVGARCWNKGAAQTGEKLIFTTLCLSLHGRRAAEERRRNGVEEARVKSVMHSFSDVAR